VETGDDLGFAFRDVERRAVRLGDTGDEIDEEQREQPGPVERRRAAGLVRDDLADVQRPDAITTPTSAASAFMRDDLGWRPDAGANSVRSPPARMMP
jgi:hypothetical protein